MAKYLSNRVRNFNIGVSSITESDTVLTAIGNTDLTGKVDIDIGSGTTAFEIQGSAGQLFSVTNNLTSGSIFSVNDVSGIPSIDVDANGTISLAPFGTNENVGVGTDDPQEKLHLDTGTLLVTNTTAPQIRLSADNTDASDNDRTMLGQATSNGNFVTNAVDNDTVLRGTSTGNLLFGVGTSEKLRITSDGNVRVPDNGKFVAGDSDDLQIYHNGTQSRISQESGGDLNIRNKVADQDIYIQTDDGTGGGNITNYFRADGSSGEVQLFYYGSEKLSTKSTGIDVTGLTETDTLAVSGTSTFESDVTITNDANLILDSNGPQKILFKDSSADGLELAYYTNGDYLAIQKTSNSNTLLRAYRDTSQVELYYNSAKKLETTTTGVTVTGTALATALSTGASGTGINISTSTITGPATLTIDPAAVGDNTGTVVIAGDLQIDGTTTTVNSTTMTVDDKNLELGTGAANDAAADGGGITIVSGDGNKTFNFEATGDNLGSSENLNLASGKAYKINNTSVLNATTLGSAVTGSSLTSVGILSSLTSEGTIKFQTTASSAGQTAFLVQDGGASPTDVFRIYENGETVIRNTAYFGPSGSQSSISPNGSSIFLGDMSIRDGSTTNIFLENNGDATFKGDITIADKIIHDGDTNTAIRFPAADTVAVETAGTERLRVKSNGRVAIGADGIASYLIDARTDENPSSGVIGNFRNNQGNGKGSFLAVSSNLKGSYSMGMPENTDAFTIVDGFGNDGTERFRITSDGSVGIGTNNPQGILHVSSGTSGDATLILEADTDNNDETDNPNIVFRQDGGLDLGSIGMNFGNSSSIVPSNELYIATSSGAGSIVFATGTTNGYTNATEKLRIDSAGQIGLGGANYGTSGQVITSNGGSSAPTWQDVSDSTITVADESSDTTCFPLFSTDATGSISPKTGSNLTFNSFNGTLTATTFSGALTGNATSATTATNFTVTANNSANETVYPVFVDGATGSQGAETDTGLSYNPSTGLFTAVAFSGSGASLTSLNASNLASGTIPDARFPATLPAVSGVNLTALTGASSGTYGDGTNVAQIVVDANGRITGISEVSITGGGGSAITVQDEGVSLSTAATTLNFVGSGVVASGTGATKTITISGEGVTSVTATDESSDTTCFPLFATSATGSVAAKTDASGLKYDSSNERLETTDVAVKGAVRYENSGSTERFEILYNETTDSLDFTYSAS